MELSQFKISKLLGIVYTKGNLVFPNDEAFYSCLGNRIGFFDLALGQSQTMPVENRYNFIRIAVSPNGRFMLAANEVGQVSLISLISMTVLHIKNLKPPIYDIKFSPDGKRFAIAKGNKVFLYRFPQTIDEQLNPFKLINFFNAFHDDVTSIDWSSDSRVIVVGGKDCQTRIFAVRKFKNLKIYSLGGHNDHIVECYFEDKSMNVYSFSRDAVVNVWECDTDLTELEPGTDAPQQQKRDKPDKGKMPKRFMSGQQVLIANDDDGQDDEEEEPDKSGGKINEKSVKGYKKDGDTDRINKIHYKRLAKYHLGEEEKSNKHVYLISVDYHKRQNLAVLGYADGKIKLYQAPNFDLIFSFIPLDNFPVDAVKFDNSGYLIAFANEKKGKLFVWNWKTKSVLLKQEGQNQNYTCLNYSSKGDKIVTGALDGTVSVWDTHSGYRLHKLSAHLGAPVTGAMFAKQGTLIVTSANDGTVRVHETNHFKNFRTFTTEHSSKISCLACDSLGEYVAGAVEETYEIYVWSIKTSKIIEVLSSHEQEVNSMSFNPGSYEMVSASGDKTVKVWNIMEKYGLLDTIEMGSEALCVAYRADGKQIAVATHNGHISFFAQATATPMGYIEGRPDLDGGRSETDLILAKTSSKDLAFNALCYTTSGQHIIAGGRSKYICLYHVASMQLLKRFIMTCNLSFDGITDLINIRKMTEFGNIALVDEREDGTQREIKLPGTRFGDMSARSHKPQARVSDIKFCPTERHWAATTTEGLLIFSLDQEQVFRPIGIDPSITPSSIQATLDDKDYLKALTQALRLSETHYIKLVVFKTPSKCIEGICKILDDCFVHPLIEYLADELAKDSHTEFLTQWIKFLFQTKPNILNQKNPRSRVVKKKIDYYLHKFNIQAREIENWNRSAIAYAFYSGTKKNKHYEQLQASSVVEEMESEPESESDMEM